MSSPYQYGGVFGHIHSTNIARPRICPADETRMTGIQKRPVEVLDISPPGPNYGDGSGVSGDIIGDDKHHGGADKAVYAFAREMLDYWSAVHQTATPYPDGHFGENLTTVGIDWTQAVIGQQIRIGNTLLEVSVPRQPCLTFARWLGIPGWVKTFAAHGDCGSYFRVMEAGQIRVGDACTFLPAPAHGITMGDAFRAKMGNTEAARRVYAAQCLPPHHHWQLERLLKLT